MKKIILVSIILFSLTICCYGNDIQAEIEKLPDDWYFVKVPVLIENITPEEARGKAIQIACNMAIEDFVGIEVTGRTSLIQTESNNAITMDHFSKLTNQTSNGIIIEKEIIKEENVAQDIHIYKILTLKVKVGKQPGEDDPYFTLKASLNKDYYQDGDQLFLEVIPSKDCYITVLNIMSNENVATLFPNEFREENFVKANERFKLPDENDRNLGIKFVVGLLPEKEEDSEIIKIIATKEPLSFSINSDYKTAFESLQNWLVKIPRNEVEEVDLQYFIIGK